MVEILIAGGVYRDYANWNKNNCFKEQKSGSQNKKTTLAKIFNLLEVWLKTYNRHIFAYNFR